MLAADCPAARDIVALMAEQRSARVNGVRLVYQVGGRRDRPPMVLLHALGERGADWAPVLDRLAEHYLVITPDLRGHGGSDWTGNYAFSQMFEDIAGLLDQLALGLVTLIGHSMGAAVAYLLAMRRPDLIGTLIIEDGSPPFKRDRPLPERPAQMWAGLPGIAAPTLLIGGGARSHIPQAKLAEAAALIRVCDLVTIEAGHNVHRERPAEFADFVLGWLKGH